MLAGLLWGFLDEPCRSLGMSGPSQTWKRIYPCLGMRGQNRTVQGGDYICGVKDGVPKRSGTSG
jgi:hypothetical protein